MKKIFNSEMFAWGAITGLVIGGLIMYIRDLVYPSLKVVSVDFDKKIFTVSVDGHSDGVSYQEIQLAQSGSSGGKMGVSNMDNVFGLDVNYRNERYTHKNRKYPTTDADVTYITASNSNDKMAEAMIDWTNKVVIYRTNK